ARRLPGAGSRQGEPAVHRVYGYERVKGRLRQFRWPVGSWHPRIGGPIDFSRPTFSFADRRPLSNQLLYRDALLNYLTQRRRGAEAQRRRGAEAQRSRGAEERRRRTRFLAQRARTNFSWGQPLGKPRGTTRAAVPKEIPARGAR